MNKKGIKICSFAGFGILGIVFFTGFPNHFKNGMDVIGSSNINRLSTTFEDTNNKEWTMRKPAVEDLKRIEMDADDVFVFLHIQKTGGTWFEYRVMQDLQMKNPCICKTPRSCMCYTANNTTWIISRMATGWPCGTHNDWTELDACLQTSVNRMKKGGLLSNDAR